MFKVSSKSTNKSCGICSKLTIKALAQRQWHRSDVSIVNFEHISHLFSSGSILDLELVNASWEYFCGTLSRCLTLRPLKWKSKRWTWDQPCQTFMMKLFSICFSIRTYSIQPLLNMMLQDDKVENHIRNLIIKSWDKSCLLNLD